MIQRDPIDEEIKAQIRRSRGMKIYNDPPDPKRAADRRRLEEIADEKRLKEQTEWL